MREVLEQRKFDRRRILISLISYAPLAPLSFGGAAEAAGKVSKQTAQYQPAPKGGQACAGCNSYIAPSQCKLVAGEISPSGWCRLWTKKEG
jgi:hypothetical protein